MMRPLALLLVFFGGAPAARPASDTAHDPAWIGYLEGRLRLAPNDAEIRAALDRARPPIRPKKFSDLTLRERLRAYARGETRRDRANWNPGRELLDAGLVAQARLYLRIPIASVPAPAPPASPVPAAPVSETPASDTFSRRVDLLLARGDVAGATEVVVRWRAAHPGDRDALAHARALLRQERAKERAKRDAPLRAVADDTLPILLRDALRASDTAAIRTLARRWRAARPSTAESWALIGLSFRRLGEADAAHAAWRRSIEIDPDQPDLAALIEGD